MLETIKLKAEVVVREAGGRFFSIEPHKSRIIEKGIADYVTEVDFAVQAFMISKLLEILPGSNIISEESDKNNYNFDCPTWILDPVDGTTNFMYRYRHSAISLALFLEGQPALGIIYKPDTDEMFSAQAGRGATLNGSVIKVTGSSELEECLIAFGTTPYNKAKAEETFETVKRFYMSCRDIRRTGSAALDIAYVACGRLDGYYEARIQPWDYAAGLVVLKEAGGRLTDLEGMEIDGLGPSGVLATNGLVHEKMLNLICKKDF